MPLRLNRRRMLGGSLALAATLPSTSIARAQAWPSKPIRIVCGLPSGGLVDLFARAYGDYISQEIGEPVIVENRPGAGGMIAAQAVKSSPADGHTLMFTLSTAMIANRVLFKELPYDPETDFAVISTMSPGHVAFIAATSTGATTIEAFAAYARDKPISVGTFGLGSLAHLFVVELNKHFGLQMEAVHYRGEAPMWQGLAAGEIQAACGTYAGAYFVLQTGAGRAIAVSRTKRMRKLPDVATFLEQGATSKAFQLRGFLWFVGAAGISQEVVQRLSRLMVEGGKSERVLNLLDAFGIDEAAVGAEESMALIAEEAPIWIDLLRGLGLPPQ